MTKKIFQKPRGTKDILPEDAKYFQFFEDNFGPIVKAVGFGKIITPAFEETGLFVRSVGKSTDIVEKEMYTFTDKSKNSLTLRPEGTASIVRAYLEDGLQSWPHPVKLYYLEPMYRYDRPQAGRYREFWQFGFEMIGDKSALADAIVISTAYRIYEKIGLKDSISLQLNSIGCQKCREKYIKELVKFYKANHKKVCPTCNIRIEKNPLRVLDCKEDKCQVIIEEAPQIMNSLCPECHAHFREVLEYLEEVGITYELNPRLVRGLDYYNRTVFEIWSQKEGAQNSLGGGGRYDTLIETLGGKNTPALGFAGGLDRVIELLKSKEIEISEKESADVYVAQIGDVARKKCFNLLNALWAEGIPAEGCLDKGTISDQLKTANKLGARFTLLIGQKEAYDDTVIIKEMSSGNQEVFPTTKVINEIKKRIKK
jgi:histidyl-tRNA synthetase